MTGTLAPYIDRCIFSFVEMYKKVKSNMPELIVITKTIGYLNSYEENVVLQSDWELVMRYKPKIVYYVHAGEKYFV